MSPSTIVRLGTTTTTSSVTNDRPCEKNLATSQVSSCAKGDRAHNSPDVISSVLDKLPNLSVFHNDDDTENRSTEVPFSPPSPLSSPSRRHGVLRRISRSGKHDIGEASKVSSALKLPLHLPKKVRSHLSIHTKMSQVSVNTTELRVTTTTTDSVQPSTDTTRRSETSLDGKYGSLHSILHDRNTPAPTERLLLLSRCLQSLDTRWISEQRAS